MITIPSMPTRFRPLPELELELDIPQLRTLANILGEVAVEPHRFAGLCIEVASRASDAHIDRIFSQAVSFGMNRAVENGASFCMYLHHYLHLDKDVALEELTAVRQAWAAHIARSIYEQIGA